MGTNRVIKTDNEIDVEGSNINLKATTDITGDCNISSNLTASGTVQGFTFPSDGTNGQILSTNGSGALSFIDAATGGGGADVISNATEATNYSGTANIIHVTATEDVVISTDLSDRIILVTDNGNVTTFRDCNLFNCSIKSRGEIHIERTSSHSPTVMKVNSCSIITTDNLRITNGTSSSSKRVSIFCCDFVCNQYISTSSYSGPSINRTKIKAGHKFDVTADINFTTTITGSFIHTGFIKSNVISTSGSTIISTYGTDGTDTVRIQEYLNSSNKFIDGQFSHPFEVFNLDIRSQVLVIAHQDAGQSIPSNVSTKIIFEDEEFDNTGSYNPTTGVFTAPVNGFYIINSMILTDSTNQFFDGQIMQLRLFVNSSLKISGDFVESRVTSGSTVVFSSQLSGMVNLSKGDTVEMHLFQNSGVNIPLLSSDNSNFLHINKVN